MNTTTTPHGVIITETEELDDVLQHDQSDQECFQYLKTLSRISGSVTAWWRWR